MTVIEIPFWTVSEEVTPSENDDILRVHRYESLEVVLTDPITFPESTGEFVSKHRWVINKTIGAVRPISVVHGVEVYWGEIKGLPFCLEQGDILKLSVTILREL